MTRQMFAALAVLLPASGWAADIPADLQVELQTTMLNYLDEVAVDGAYTYLDTEQDQMMTVYPANVHPFVIQVGDAYFVCSEMIDEEGNTLTADFLVREIGGDYRVVQAILGDRDAVRALMSNAGQ